MAIGDRWEADALKWTVPRGNALRVRIFLAEMTAEEAKKEALEDCGEGGTKF